MPSVFGAPSGGPSDTKGQATAYAFTVVPGQTEEQKDTKQDTRTFFSSFSTNNASGGATGGVSQVNPATFVVSQSTAATGGNVLPQPMVPKVQNQFTQADEKKQPYHTGATTVAQHIRENKGVPVTTPGTPIDHERQLQFEVTFSHCAASSHELVDRYLLKDEGLSLQPDANILSAWLERSGTNVLDQKNRYHVVPHEIYISSKWCEGIDFGLVPTLITTNIETQKTHSWTTPNGVGVNELTSPVMLHPNKVKEKVYIPIFSADYDHITTSRFRRWAGVNAANVNQQIAAGSKGPYFVARIPNMNQPGPVSNHAVWTAASQYPHIANVSTLPHEQPVYNEETHELSVTVDNAGMQKLMHSTIQEVNVGSHAMDLSTLTLRLAPEPGCDEKVMTSRMNHLARNGGAFKMFDKMFRVGVRVTIVGAVISPYE